MGGGWVSTRREHGTKRALASLKPDSVPRRVLVARGPPLRTPPNATARWPGPATHLTLTPPSPTRPTARPTDTHNHTHTTNLHAPPPPYPQPHPPPPRPTFPAPETNAPTRHNHATLPSLTLHHTPPPTLLIQASAPLLPTPTTFSLSPLKNIRPSNHALSTWRERDANSRPAHGHDHNASGTS